MSENIFESDFSADDSTEDPDYNPSTNKRIRLSNKESGGALKKHTPSDARKIIFKAEFYADVQKTFDKCNNLWKKCKWPKSSEIIAEYLGSSLLLPVVTRWNSLYDAVKKLLCYKEQLNSLCDKLSLPNFSQGDLQYLEMYVLVMEPIAKALDFLQGENNVNYALLNGIICITIDPQSTNGNVTDVDVRPTQHKQSNMEDNITLVADSELSASERTRRLLPYMAFYVPVQDLPINQQYSPIPMTNHAARPSAPGASGTVLSLPPQYVHAKVSSPSAQGIGPVNTLYLPSPSAAGASAGPHYQPSAGDVYHTLTHGGPQQQHYHHPHFQQLPAAIKQIDNNGNQKYPGHHLLLAPGPPGPSAPSNVNLAGGKIKPIRHKTVQHFPPLPSQSAAPSATPSAYGGTSSGKQQNVVAAYRPRSKQSKINLTPFTPSNSVPGNFVPIVYTPINSNSNSNNNIVITSHATASSHDEAVTRLNEDAKQQKIAIEYSPPFPPPPPPQSIDEVPTHHHQHHHHQQQHHPSASPSGPSLDPEQAHHHHQPNPKQQAQYFSVTSSTTSAGNTAASTGGVSEHQHKQTASPPSIYQHQHPEHTIIDASSRPRQQLTLIGSKQQQTTTQQYRPLQQFYPSKPENFFDTELQQPQQQHHYVDQQNTRYGGKQSQSPPSPQEQHQSYVARPNYRERIKQQTQQHQPAHIFVLSSTATPHHSPVTALAPIHPSQNPHYAPKYPQHSPKHHALYPRPDLGSSHSLAQQESHNNDATSSPAQSQLPFGEQILTIPVRTLFSDLRNIQHSQYSQSPSPSPSPSSSHSLAYPKLNGPSTTHYFDYPVEEPKQSLDEDQNDSHQQHVETLKPTLGRPSHGYIIVTTAAPIVRQPVTYENYGSTVRPLYKNKINVILQPLTKETNSNYPAIRQPHPTAGPIMSVTPTPTPNAMVVDSGPKYVYVKQEFGQKLSTPSVKLKPLSKNENNKQIPTKPNLQQPGHDNVPLQVLASQPGSHPNVNAHNQAVAAKPTPTPTPTPPPQLRPSGILADPNELPDIRTSSLAEILHKLQESNHLPHTLTPDNIDNSIKTLIRILNNLKQTQTIVANPPQNHDTPPPSSPDYDYTTSSEEQDHKQHDLNVLSPAAGPNKHPGPSTGRPGIDYPNYAEIPHTSFDCTQQRYKGFFGDPETSCQVWHYCDLNGGKASFLCPNGTIFSQIALTCDWWFNVKCASTAQLYVLNERLYKYILPFTPKFPEDYSGPLVDKYLAMKFQEMEEKMRLEKEKALQEAATEHEHIQEQPHEDSREENRLDDTTTEKTSLQSSVAPLEHKTESINSHVSEQSSERNLLIDDEVDDISQRGSVDTFESTTIATMTASVKPQELPLSLKPIVVSSTMEPDYEDQAQHNYVKRREDHILTSNKTEINNQTLTFNDSAANDSQQSTSAKGNNVKITVEKVEVIEIQPDGATGHIIREMILNSETQ